MFSNQVLQVFPGNSIVKFLLSLPLTNHQNVLERATRPVQSLTPPDSLFNPVAAEESTVGSRILTVAGEVRVAVPVGQK